MTRRRDNFGRTVLIFASSALVVSVVTRDIDRQQYPTLYPIVWCALYLAILSVVYWLYRKIKYRRRFKIAQFNELLALTPAQFESAVGEILTTAGYRKMERIGQAGDLCADLRGTGPRGNSIVVQCKRYAPGSKVGTPAIQTFIGMMAVHHQSEGGVFVTTSTFTKPAIALANQHDITLIDGPTLSGLLKR
jgi:restriction system protein